MRLVRLPRLKVIACRTQPETCLGGTYPDRRELRHRELLMGERNLAKSFSS